MMFVLPVIALLFVAFITQPTPCESLKCYECSGNKSCGWRQNDHIVDCAGKCLSYLNEDNNGTIIRRCCSDNCKIENGDKIYSCSEDKCNGIHSDRKLLAMKNKIFQKRIILKRAAEEQTSSMSCYDCSAHNPNCGVDEATVVRGCRACLVYRNIYDGNNVIRGCCNSGCGAPDTIGDYNGRTAYFCSSDRCNGIGAENVLIDAAELTSTATTFSALSSTVTTATATAPTTTMTTTVQTPFSCYDCSAHNPNCGVDEATVVRGCRACLVYRNIYDGNNVIRGCCNSGCGAPDTIGDYNGRTAYFCSSDRCNGIGAENVLIDAAELTSTTTMFSALSSTVTTGTATAPTTTMMTTVQTPFSCYDCSGYNAQQCTSTISNCPMCMVYRNDNDPTQFERRCCWWACGSPNQVADLNGRPTYFCNSDKCNGPGSEAVLGYITTTNSPTTVASTTIPTTTSATQKTSFQCYDCSGSDCGNEGSTLATNCRSCMVYRNPDDQTKIERRCCWWWGCGSSDSIGTYDGMEAYFCADDKCNGYGTESALSPAVITTTNGGGSSSSIMMTTSVTITSQMTTETTSSASSCVLNCQNGGTPETEDGCFCYCLENTSGRECENVDCSQPDLDSETCSSDNQPLCEESETFAFECLHLCEKC